MRRCIDRKAWPGRNFQKRKNRNTKCRLAKRLRRFSASSENAEKWYVTSETGKGHPFGRYEGTREEIDAATTTTPNITHAEKIIAANIKKAEEELD